MCTDICPCYKGNYNFNYIVYNTYIGEDMVNYFGRTLNETDTSNSTTTYLPFVWADKYFNQTSNSTLNNPEEAEINSDDTIVN